MTSSGSDSNVGSSGMPAAGQQIRNVSESSDEKKEGEFLKFNLMIPTQTYPWSGGGHIRVGREYQAVLPANTPPDERLVQDCAERAMMVWAPSREEDVKCRWICFDDKFMNFASLVDKYIQIAIDKYGYNREQALAMLFWHKHDMDRALQDLANFTPVPNEWSMDDKLLFEQAFKVIHSSC